MFYLTEGDLEPFEWCCRKSSLCNLFYEKRPVDKCENYTSLGLGKWIATKAYIIFS